MDQAITPDPDSLAEPNWNFAIRNINAPLNVPTGSFMAGAMKAKNRINMAAGTFGILGKTDDETKLISITAVSQFAQNVSDPSLIFGHMPGYEFRYQGQIVGAVEVVGFGRVWFRDSLDPELKFVLATMAVALLGQEVTQKQL